MAETFFEGDPIPAKLGEVVDLYARTRAVRLAMKHKTDAIEKREHELYEHMLRNLGRGENGAAGFTHRVHRLEDKKEPKPDDWELIFAHIAQTGRFDFLHKRLSSTAIKEAWENGEVVPGVSHIFVPDLSVTKIPARAGR